MILHTSIWDVVALTCQTCPAICQLTWPCRAAAAGGDWAAAVLWSELASYQFFVTGHQATLPAIQWDAAVPGLQVAPDGTLLPGLCVLASTFAGELAAALSLPLLLCAPHLGQVGTAV